MHHDKEYGDDQENKGHYKQYYNVQCKIVLGIQILAKILEICKHPYWYNGSQQHKHKDKKHTDDKPHYQVLPESSCHQSEHTNYYKLHLAKEFKVKDHAECVRGILTISTVISQLRPMMNRTFSKNMNTVTITMASAKKITLIQ